MRHFVSRFLQIPEESESIAQNYTIDCIAYIPLLQTLCELQ